MPLSKRHIFDPHLYAPPDLYEESSKEDLLQDVSMSGTLGAIHQIKFLSLYSIEVLDNLIRLSEDVSDRIQTAAVRTQILWSKIGPVERKVRSTDITTIPKKRKAVQKFKSRNAYIPSTLTKNTNSVQILSQYGFCNIPPQLWKMETVIDDCVARYSHPGFFFEEWLKVELLRQQEYKREKRKAKEERKKKRRKRREEEGESAEMSARDRAKAHGRQLKEEKRQQREQAAREAEENRKRAAAASRSFMTVDSRSMDTINTMPAHDSKPPAVLQSHEEKISEVKHTLTENFGVAENTRTSSPPLYSQPPDVDGDHGNAATLDELPPLPDERLSPPPDGIEEYSSPPPLSPSPPPSPPANDDDVELLPPPPDDDEIEPPPPDDDWNEPPPPDDDLPPPPVEDDSDEPPPPDDDDEPPPPDDDDEPPPPDTLQDPTPKPVTSIPAAISPPQPGAAPVVKTAPKVRRKSLLDLKADREALSAAAVENLKHLNVVSTADDDIDPEVLADSDIAKSIRAFSEAGSGSRRQSMSGVPSPSSSPRLSLLSTHSMRRSSVGAPPTLVSDGQWSHQVPRRPSIPFNRTDRDSEGSRSTLRPFTASNDPGTTRPTTSEVAEQTYDQSQYWDVQEEQDQHYGYDGYDGQMEYHDSNYNYDTGEYNYERQHQYDVDQDAGNYGAYEDELPDDSPQLLQQSSLSVYGGDLNILGQIRTGKVLRKAPPPIPKLKSARESTLDLIKDGAVQLRKTEPISKKNSTEQRHEAIAAILSNRAQIAGSDSDSDSDDSDSDFSDDFF